MDEKRHRHPIVVAMDIDDFLTSMQVDELRERDWRDPVHHGDSQFFTVAFEHNGASCEVENVLTPGCIEFFRFLFEQEDVRPAFFSSSTASSRTTAAPFSLATGPKAARYSPFFSGGLRKTKGRAKVGRKNSYGR